MRFQTIADGAGLAARCTLGVLALAAVTLADPLNGDFEQGSLNGWTQTGDGNAGIVATGDLSPLGPIAGSYSGFVDNGPGATGAEGSIGILRSSPFISPTLGGTLSFSFDFLTSEWTGEQNWLDGVSGLDSFRVELFDILASTTEVLASGSVVDSTFTDFASVVSAPDGTSYYSHTGTMSFTRAFTGAGSYRLLFIVEDGPVYDWFGGGDPIPDDTFDSGLLIDSVNFVENQPVPEPSTLALVGLGGLAVLLRRRRRR